VARPRAGLERPRTDLSSGQTPEIRPDQVAKLLTSIDVSSKIGLRDRAVLAVLIYTAAGVGAAANLTLKSVKHDGSQYTLRFSEKGGKSREIPVRHDLELALLAYMEAAAITESPLFRTAAGKTEKLTENPMTAIDICRMMKRRLKAAGLPGQYSPHSFRVATVTDLLEQNVELESVQDLAGHADPRTTRLYDRRRRKVTRNIVERISIDIGQE
jgi:integrase/recombinase XerD